MSKGVRVQFISTKYQSLKAIAWGKTAQSGYWAILDQGLVSASNFFTTFFLARYLSQEDFGIFSLGYAILLFVTGLQMGLITNPLMVLGAPLENEERKRYFSAVAVLQTVFGIAFSLSFLTLGLILKNSVSGGVLITLSLIIFVFTGQEYLRRCLFTALENRQAIINDFVCYGFQVVGLIAVFSAGLLSSKAAFYVIGITSFFALVLGLFQLRKIWIVRSLPIRNTVVENWRYGKWLVASSLATYTSSQAYLFIAAFMLTPAAAGTIKAAQNILGPTHVLLNGFGNFSPQIAATKYVNGGVPELKRFLKKIALVLMTIMGGYSLLVVLGAETILKIFYGDKYSGNSDVVVLFAIQYLLVAAATVIGFGLRAIQQTRILFNSYLASSILTCVVSYPLVRYLGINGAVSGIMIASAFVTAYTYRGLKSHLHT